MVEFTIKNPNTNVKVSVANFSQIPLANKVISSQTQDLIARLLLENIYFAGIAISTGVSQKWLQNYVNNQYAPIERIVKVQPTKNSD